MSYFAGKKVVVTGGAGFIGSYLVELLLHDGAEVTVADNLSRGRLDNLDAVLGEVRFLELDLREPSAARKACSGQEAALHLASAVAGVEYSSTHHGRMFTDVTLLAANVLEAARVEGVERYLFCSSSCVYPDDAFVPTPETDSQRGTPEACNEGYGWGKRMGELQAKYYAAEYGMEVAIARPFNSYGARQYPEDLTRANVIPAVISRVLGAEEPLVVWGSGNQTRSFVHGRDTALGLKLLAESYATADPVNIGHDAETSIRELVELVQDIGGVRRTILFDTSRPEGPLRKGADVTKLRAVTGFEPGTDLRAGLEEMIDFFRKVGVEPEDAARAAAS